MNQFKTFGLMAILTLILIYLGGLIGGQYGALMALVVAVLQIGLFQNLNM